MDDDFEYDDFLDMMEDQEISYRDEYRNQTAFLNEGHDHDYDDTEFAGYDDDAARGDEDAFTD
jgi:hypothetical protein